MLVGGVCVGVARVLLDVIKTMARFFIRRWHLHDEVALFIGTAIVVVLAITLINGVLIRGFLAGANRVFQPQNTTTRAGVVQPAQPERSGSPTSFAPWETLGFQGRNFVATGPHADELTRLNGRPAKEPIRVYVGLQTADTDESRMAVLLSELERTGAFSRKLLVIVPTTGTGWINPVAARSLEMMYNGDTAMVGSQYSYLPSWISFLGDRQKSMESGRMMINAIHDRWLQLPPDRRPKLVLYGESLGSMAGQGAFGWLPDIARMGFSSVLWVGPPNASPLWSAITERRDPGTPEVEPRYDNGRTVRFSQATDAAEIARRHGGAVGGHPGAVPAASVGPDRVVVAGSAVQPAGLAEGTARPRPHGVDALVSDHHVLAGRRRHDQRRRRFPAGTATTTATTCSTAGPPSRRPTGGRPMTPNASASRWRRPNPPTGPNTDAVQQVSRGRTGRGAGGVELCGTAGAMASDPERVAGHRDSSRSPALRSDCARLRCGRACGTAWPPARRRRSVSRRYGVAAGARGDGRARPARAPGSLAVAGHPDRNGLARGSRLPGHAGHRRRRGVRADPRPAAAGRGVRVMAHRRRPHHRRARDRHRAGHRRCGLVVRLASRAVGQPRRADAGAPGGQRGRRAGGARRATAR